MRRIIIVGLILLVLCLPACDDKKNPEWISATLFDSDESLSLQFDVLDNWGLRDGKYRIVPTTNVGNLTTTYMTIYPFRNAKDVGGIIFYVGGELRVAESNPAYKIVSENETTINDLPIYEMRFEVSAVNWDLWHIFTEKDDIVYKFTFMIFDEKPDNIDDIFTHIKNSIR